MHNKDPEFRKKLSLLKTGFALSYEAKKKMSISHAGVPLSEEHKKAIGESNKGKHRSEDLKEKLRSANTGKHLLAETKTKIGLANKGRKLSEDHKDKISLANKGRPPTTLGKKPWNYNPNKEREYPLTWNNELKTFIRNLDGRHCTNCGRYDKPLSVHHINWIKVDTFAWNLISLCRSCHAKAHSLKNKMACQIKFWNYTTLRNIPEAKDNFNILELSF